MDSQANSVSHPNDMTLVSFVVLLLKQWKIMLACISCIMLLTLVALWLKPVKYDFATMYAVASYETLDGEREGLETPEEVIAKLENVFIEQQRRQLLEDQSVQGIPFDIEVTNPRNTLLLRIVSESSSEHQPMIEQFHDGLVSSIQQDQQQLVEGLMAGLNAQQEAYSQALEAARESSSENARELEASFFEKILQLERRIESINPGDSDQRAVQSLEPVGVGKTFILAFGGLVALLLAPLMAVFSVFVKQVAVAYRRAQ
ncbi:lipopolysaccharide biosynthesis protein [Vreelandella aquamarina]|uniref:lipopolysaccharide biosynthesis protein n=1 Tax=Vreelandella aquamarina TaxID=77097 RepID=UPI00384D9DEB